MLNFDKHSDQVKIIRYAASSKSNITDGCAVYDVDTDCLRKAYYMANEVENPLNHFLELYRLPSEQVIDQRCYMCNDCPFWDNEKEVFDYEMVDEKGKDWVTCCIESMLKSWDLYTGVSFEEDIRERVSYQMINILNSPADEEYKQRIKELAEKWEIKL